MLLTYIPFSSFVLLLSYYVRRLLTQLYEVIIVTMHFHVFKVGKRQESQHIHMFIMLSLSLLVVLICFYEF